MTRRVITVFCYLISLELIPCVFLTVENKIYLNMLPIFSHGKNILELLSKMYWVSQLVFMKWLLVMPRKLPPSATSSDDVVVWNYYCCEISIEVNYYSGFPAPLITMVHVEWQTNTLSICKLAHVNETYKIQVFEEKVTCCIHPRWYAFFFMLFPFIDFNLDICQRQQITWWCASCIRIRILLPFSTSTITHTKDNR